MRLERGTNVVREIYVVANVRWEVHGLPAAQAPFEEASVGLLHLPEIVQEVIAAYAVFVSVRAQHSSSQLVQWLPSCL